MAKPKPLRPHAQLSFDALLIHGLMLFFVAATITVVTLLDPDSREVLAALGTGAAAVVVLAVWSVVLAVRALRKKENSRWPKRLIPLPAVELLFAVVVYVIVRATSGLSLHDCAMAVALPIFIPVLGFAALIAAPIAWWRTHRAERKDVKSGSAPWDKTRRWKRGLLWFCPIAAALVVVTLPIPLFIFCADPLTWRAAPPRPHWQWWGGKNTPVAVGEAAAKVLAYSARPRLAVSYAGVLRTGRVSNDRLEDELNAEDVEVARSALLGLWSSNRPRTLDLALKVGQGIVTMRHSTIEFHLGGTLRFWGDPEKVQSLLDPTQTPWPPSDFLDGVLGVVGSKQRVQYVRDLEKLCDSDSKDREAALKKVARLGTPQDIERLWTRYLTDANAERRKQAVAAIPFIQSPDTALTVFAIGIESADVSVRRDVMRNIDDLFMAGYERAQRSVLERLVKALLPLLDNQDLGTRQDAAWGVVTLMKNPELDKRVRTFNAWTAEGDSERKSAASLTPEAHKLQDDIRAAAKNWANAR